MTTEWKIGVDWRRKGVICWDAQPYIFCPRKEHLLCYMEWQSYTLSEHMSEQVSNINTTLFYTIEARGNYFYVFLTQFINFIHGKSDKNSSPAKKMPLFDGTNAKNKHLCQKDANV